MTSGSLLDRLLTYVGCILVALWPVVQFTRMFFPSEATMRAMVTPAFGPIVDTIAAQYELLVAAIVALPLAVLYWRSSRSLGKLGAFYFWVVLLAFVLGFASFVILGAFDAAPTTDSPVSDLLDAVFISAVYVTAYWVVYRGGYDRLRSPSA